MELTGGWETDSFSTIGDDRDLVNFEPDSAAAIPSSDIAAGGLGHVDVDKSLVIHGHIGLETNGRSSTDSQSRCGGMGLRSETAKVSASYVGNLTRGQSL